MPYLPPLELNGRLNFFLLCLKKTGNGFFSTLYFLYISTFNFSIFVYLYFSINLFLYFRILHFSNFVFSLMRYLLRATNKEKLKFYPSPLMTWPLLWITFFCGFPYKNIFIYIHITNVRLAINYSIPNVFTFFMSRYSLIRKSVLEDISSSCLQNRGY